MLLSITEAIGRFHPVLVHLPIGILLVGLLLQALARKEKYNISTEVIKIVLLCGSVSAFLACITGFLLSGSGDYETGLVAWHMWMGIGVAAASLLLIARTFKQQYDIVHRITSFSLLMLIVVTGHLGSSLTHGENYLTEAWSTNKDTPATRKPIVNKEKAMQRGKAAESELAKRLLLPAEDEAHWPPQKNRSYRSVSLRSYNSGLTRARGSAKN